MSFVFTNLGFASSVTISSTNSRGEPCSHQPSSRRGGDQRSLQPLRHQRLRKSGRKPRSKPDPCRRHPCGTTRGSAWSGLLCRDCLVCDAISKDEGHADGSSDAVSCSLPKQWVIRSLCHVFLFSMCNLIIPRKCDISVETILPRIPAGKSPSHCVKITHGPPACRSRCTESPNFSP